MDDCEAMDMIDKLNEEHDITFKENAEFRKLNKSLKTSDKKLRKKIKHLNEHVIFALKKDKENYYNRCLTHIDKIHIYECDKRDLQRYCDELLQSNNHLYTINLSLKDDVLRLTNLLNNNT